VVPCERIVLSALLRLQLCYSNGCSCYMAGSPVGHSTCAIKYIVDPQNYRGWFAVAVDKRRRPLPWEVPTPPCSIHSCLPQRLCRFTALYKAATRTGLVQTYQVLRILWGYGSL
jgi:hypothetical protein